MEKYKNRRRDAYTQSLKQKNALSLRPNHALLKMEADIESKGLDYNVKEERKTEKSDFPSAMPEESKIPHFMTSTKAYRIEVSARGAREKRLKNEGRPTIHEMQELFREADKLNEGFLSASSVANVMSSIDLFATGTSIKRYAQEEVTKRNHRRRNTLTSNVPDNQTGALPAYVS